MTCKSIRTVVWHAGIALLTATGAWGQDADLRRGAGRAYAERVCAECHAVLGTERSSPRDDAPSFHAIANTPGVTATALQVWLVTPHKTMPNLIIPADDRDAVVAYIMSLRDRR